MSYLVLYLLFAVTTGIASVYVLSYPSIKQAQREGIVNEFTEHPILSNMVVGCICTLIAPIIFFTLFALPDFYYDRMRLGFDSVVMKQRD